MFLTVSRINHLNRKLGDIEDTPSPIKLIFFATPGPLVMFKVNLSIPEQYFKGGLYAFVNDSF